ncbi:uncharacterized protein BJ171DRAFT_577633 [Polychytrium aggregatum]|uniref:uncharacterized protein n=1 Tax=Polychytrium aggregatum TaxID=110093 RepID=UPI0022FEF73B|nr:uncharacterized protein BJ171DRAFT_577633 [Polychytrium aggregatum]KAI9208534.1 hypothetical protein BJ171DRAFT_577633 [Polychytrium aggregatum]
MTILLLQKVEPLMFSYSSYDHPSQTQIKVGNSEWSKRISFEAVGSSFDVGIPLQNQGQIHIGVNVKEGEGKYFLTKVVTLTPRYMIKNNLSEELHFKQVGTDVSQVLQPGVAFPLTTIISSGRNPHLTVRLGGIMNTWSSPFSINLIGRIHVKLGLAGSEAEDLIRADIIVEGATVFVVFAKETGRWPFRIDNQCSCNVAIWQQHKDDTTSRIYRIPAGKSLSYAWDYPSAENKSLILHVNGREQAIDLLEVGQIVPIRYMDPNEKKSATMAISVNAEGPTQILRLTPYIEERSHFRRGKRSSEKERALTESEKDGFELIDVDEKVVATYLVRLEGIGISLISKGMQELIYASAKDVRLEFQETKTLQRVNFTVKWLQVDNQLYGGIVPILLYPTVIPKEGSENFYPVLLITLSKSKDTLNKRKDEDQVLGMSFISF